MQASAQLVRRKILDAGEIEAARQRAGDLMNELNQVLLEPVPGGSGTRRIKATEWPDPKFVDVGVRGDLGEFATARFADRDTFTGPLEQVKFIDSVAAVMTRRMETDDAIVVLGEDVHRLNGGTNGATRGLKDKFPDRVLGTPISENSFCGLAGGMALDGRYRPVVELMYADFMWVAADQLFNQIGKARHMFGGRRQRAAGAARSKVRHGHRVRLAALHGSGGHHGYLAGLADRGPVHAVRLRGADEQRAALRGSGRGPGACGPVRVHGRGSGR